jgi:hypothetical protein
MEYACGLASRGKRAWTTQQCDVSEDTEAEIFSFYEQRGMGKATTYYSRSQLVASRKRDTV